MTKHEPKGFAFPPLPSTAFLFHHGEAAGQLATGVSNSMEGVEAVK